MSIHYEREQKLAEFGRELIVARSIAKAPPEDMNEDDINDLLGMVTKRVDNLLRELPRRKYKMH